MWFVIKNKQGEYADEYFSWSSKIHSSDQIFAKDELPYLVNSAMSIILVAEGEKPTLQEVNKIL